MWMYVLGGSRGGVQGVRTPPFFSKIIGIDGPDPPFFSKIIGIDFYSGCRRNASIDFYSGSKKKKLKGGVQFEIQV